MTHIKWHDKYSVGIEEMDNQHHHLVKLINDLYDARLSGEGKEQIGETIQGIIAYVKLHFTSEEQLMSDNKYPGLQEHTAEHIKLIKKVVQFKKRFDSHAPLSPLEIISFLKQWLVEHIQDCDKTYGSYITRKQKTTTIPSS